MSGFRYPVGTRYRCLIKIKIKIKIINRLRKDWLNRDKTRIYHLWSVRLCPRPWQRSVQHWLRKGSRAQDKSGCWLPGAFCWPRPSPGSDRCHTWVGLLWAGSELWHWGRMFWCCPEMGSCYWKKNSVTKCFFNLKKTIFNY